MTRRRCSLITSARESQEEPRLGPELKQRSGGVYMANQQLDQQTAKALIAAAEADACAWGKDYIAHPDLVRCFDEGLPLNEADSSTFYGGGARGYTDYPFAE